jgi:hypothetical protein
MWLCPCVQFVLLVGCIGLAVYTATQVFGWSGVVLSQTGSGYGEHHTAGGAFGVLFVVVISYLNTGQSGSSDELDSMYLVSI